MLHSVHLCDLDYVIGSERVGVGPLVGTVQLGTEMTKGSGQGLGSGLVSLILRRSDFFMIRDSRNFVDILIIIIRCALQEIIEG